VNIKQVKEIERRIIERKERTGFHAPFPSRTHISCHFKSLN